MGHRAYSRRRKKSKINFGRLAVFIVGVVVLCAGAVGVVIGAQKLVHNIFAKDEAKEVSGDKGQKGDGIKEFQYADIEEGAIKSPYGAVYDVENQRLTAGRRTDVKIYPASMTKVMTLVVAVEHLESLEQQFTISDDIIAYAKNGNFVTAGFLSGETVTAEDLLYGLILQSGADCAEGIARMVSGSQSAFARLMNEKAAQMGLTGTHFTNALGAHDDEHYTTVEDMVRLFDYAMKNETCARILSCMSYTTAPTWAHTDGLSMDNHAFTNLTSDTSDMADKGGITITAVKAGFTDEAGRCLITYAAKNDRHFITVTAMAASSKDASEDAYTLLKNYAN